MTSYIEYAEHHLEVVRRLAAFRIAMRCWAAPRPPKSWSSSSGQLDHDSNAHL